MDESDMEDVDVHLWIEDRDDVVTYTVAVEDGVTNTDEAVAEAQRLAEADGHEDVNLKEIESAE